MFCAQLEFLLELRPQHRPAHNRGTALLQRRHIECLNQSTLLRRAFSQRHQLQAVHSPVADGDVDCTRDV